MSLHLTYESWIVIRLVLEIHSIFHSVEYHLDSWIHNQRDSVPVEVSWSEPNCPNNQHNTLFSLRSKLYNREFPRNLKLFVNSWGFLVDCLMEIARGMDSAFLLPYLPGQIEGHLEILWAKITNKYHPFRIVNGFDSESYFVFWWRVTFRMLTLTKWSWLTVAFTRMFVIDLENSFRWKFHVTLVELSSMSSTKRIR